LFEKVWAKAQYKGGSYHRSKERC